MPPPVVPPVVPPVEPVEPVEVVPPAAGTLAMTRAVKVKSTVFGLLNLQARVAVSSFGRKSAPTSCE